MRLIGQLDQEQQARTLADYLYSQGIETQVDPHPEGHWEIWVLDDDEVETGSQHLQRFQQHPQAPEFLEGAQVGAQQQRRNEKQATPKRARVIDGRTAFQRPAIAMGPVTIILILLSIAVTVLTHWGNENIELTRWLSIANYNFRGNTVIWQPGLEEIRQGQIWRLFTPMFLHFTILHIFFNMWWLKDLGAIIETFKGSWVLLGLTLVIAAVSNVAQFFVGGPMFGGMSGVVYGLLGYLWIYGKCNPASPIRLNPQIVQFMIIWFFVCLIGVIPHVANTVHGIGAVMGMGMGYLNAQWAKRR